MFVTSIDVEEGMWPNGRKAKNNDKRSVRQTVTRSETQEVENVVLDYGEEDDNMIPSQREYSVHLPGESATAESKNGNDWLHVEKNWDKLSKFTEASQVSVGALVGWKVSVMSPSLSSNSR